MTLRNKLFASPVNRLVICAARPYPDEEATGTLRALVREGVDWDAVLQTAREAKVLPLVSRNLRKAAEDLLPADVAERFREAFQANTWRNLKQTAELVRLVRCLAAHGIEALPFKGPVLAQALYDNLALRQFSDLDVLVPEADFPRAVTLVREAGYRQERPGQVLADEQVEAVMRHFDDYHFRFVHPERHVALELHWKLLRRTEMAPFLSPPPRTVVIAGCLMPVLAPEPLIHYLCLHGGKDDWRRLSWICDVAALLHRYEDLDWERVLARAEASGAARRLCLGVHLAHELLSARVPPALSGAIAAHRREIEKAAAVCRLLQPTDVGLPSGTYLRYQCRIRERLREKVRYLGAYVLTPKHWVLTGDLPAERFFFLYYLRRPRHIAGNYVRRLLRPSGAG